MLKGTAPLSLIHNSLLQRPDQSPCNHHKPSHCINISISITNVRRIISQSPTETLLPQTAEDLLNRTPKQCSSYQLARTLTESQKQQSAASYKKRSLQVVLNKISPFPHEAERRLKNQENVAMKEARFWLQVPSK
jgi:hypothetical protein